MASAYTFENVNICIFPEATGRTYLVVDEHDSRMRGRRWHPLAKRSVIHLSPMADIAVVAIASDLARRALAADHLQHDRVFLLQNAAVDRVANLGRQIQERGCCAFTEHAGWVLAGV